MWCIPTLTPEFIERMEDVLDLYAKPYNPREPVICFDEKSKQLLEDIKHPQQANKGKLRRRDYEYKRRGAVNIFLSVEPHAGYRSAIATKRRTKADFARELRRIIQLPRYQRAKTIHIVLDNLNTHNEQSLEETFGKQKTKKIMRHIRFHYTPKHASWLNMAEIEIGVMSQQAIKGRIPTHEFLNRQLAAWKKRRNRKQATIKWAFTTKAARKKFKYKGSKLC